ncbi:MAG: capsular biosynthesis protein [Proteobacteria bacterium]|nr:capsular biosynthesis protein [Pseudomonadota bacterium]
MHSEPDAAPQPARPLRILMTPGGARPLFNALLTAVPGSQPVWTLPWSWRGYPETAGVAQRAWATFQQTARRSSWRRWLPRPWAQTLIGWQYNGMRRRFEREPGSLGVCWNGFDRNRLVFRLAARDAGHGCLCAELAPLPGVVTLDAQGVNDANSVPRDPAFYPAWAAAHPAPFDWRAIGANLTARKPRSASAAAAAGPSEDELAAQPYLFLPLQVPGDSQVRYFGDWIASIEQLIEAVEQAARHLPVGWHLRIKEHPSSRIRLGHLVGQQPDSRCRLDNASDTFTLVRHSRGVVTINSSVGLQSFFFDQPVIVLGRAFYGFEPLVQRARSVAELGALFGAAASLTVDARLREQFMRYLQQDYFLPYDLKAGGPLTAAARQHLARLMAQP